MPSHRLIAHRGACAYEPENTLAALDRARALGAAWAEVDAQVAADGTVVLMHDHTVDRTTEGQGPVAMMRGADVLALRTRDPATGELSQQTPPSLPATLDRCATLDLAIVVEIKATWGVDAEDACAVAACFPEGPHSRILVTSFSVPALVAFRNARPDVALGLACLRPPADPATTASELGLSAIHSSAAYTTDGDLQRMMSAGLDVAVATINEAQRARWFLERGAAVMTDFPDLLDR